MHIIIAPIHILELHLSPGSNASIAYFLATFKAKLVGTVGAAPMKVDN
jgi:hypothetical protein